MTEELREEGRSGNSQNTLPEVASAPGNLAGVDMLTPPPRWRVAGQALEDGAKMRLRLEPSIKRNFDKRRLSRCHELLGMLDPAREHKIMWPLTRRCTKLSSEMHPG